MDYVFYFAVTIGILVFVHELGHFLAAKICGMRADVFAIGFGKRLMGWNKISGFSFGNLPKDFDGEGHTDYRLSMLPLGGYVKIAGMVDESFSTDFADKEPKPYEFRAKPTYQKLFVITAGVMMNLTLAVLIFWGINFYQGKLVRETTTIGFVAEESVASEAGFQTGDEVISVNGKEVSNWEEVLNGIFIDNIGNEVNVKVIRNGNEETVSLPSKLIADQSQQGIFLTSAFVKPVITNVLENSPALDAGIEPGDIFLELNGIELNSRFEATEIISSNKEVEIPLVILRGDDTVFTAVTPGFEGMIGVAIADGAYLGPYNYQTYGFFESFAQSITNIGQYTVLTFQLFRNVIFGDIQFNQVFGGPVKIAKFAAESADTGIVSFLFFLAMLSLSLAIINILPFPVLDGGHMVIIIIEGIIRKELPVKIKEGIQFAGLVMILMLMAFVIYSDLISL